MNSLGLISVSLFAACLLSCLLPGTPPAEFQFALNSAGMRQIEQGNVCLLGNDEPRAAP